METQETDPSQPLTTNAETLGIEPSLSNQLLTAQEESAQWHDRFLRKAAELENQRKRHSKELEDTRRQALESVLKKLLPVLDNVERATSTLDAKPTVKSLGEGLRILKKQFDSTLDKLGVERIETVDEAFNPQFHEAVQAIESDKPAGTIVQEFQSGWKTKDDQVLRAAMVQVSK